MGAKQSKRSVDISGKEAESAGEVAAAGAGGEGRVEAIADGDLKPQINGDAHIQAPQEITDKEKQLDSGTPENEKDATTEKESKEEQNGEKEATPVTNGENEPKEENGDTVPTPEDGKKPKKEKVKKKWSLRSISFSRKDKPKQEKKSKEEEPKTNGEPEKVPEEAAEATTEIVENKIAEVVKSDAEVKEEKTPETPVTEPLTNGSSSPASPPGELAADAPAPPQDPAPTQPDQLPVNGLSLEEPKKETPEVVPIEESKPEETTIAATETIPVPEIPVKTEVCDAKMPLIEPSPPPLPANPPPSSVASFAATTMAPELIEASLSNTTDNAILAPPANLADKPGETETEPLQTVTNSDLAISQISPPLKETVSEDSSVPEITTDAEIVTVNNDLETPKHAQEIEIVKLESKMETVTIEAKEETPRDIVADVIETDMAVIKEPTNIEDNKLPVEVEDIKVPTEFVINPEVDNVKMEVDDETNDTQNAHDVSNVSVGEATTNSNRIEPVVAAIVDIEKKESSFETPEPTSDVPDTIDDLPPPPPLENDIIERDVEIEPSQIEVPVPTEEITNANHSPAETNGVAEDELAKIRNVKKDALGKVVDAIECNGNGCNGLSPSPPPSPGGPAAGAAAPPPPPAGLAPDALPQDPLPIADKIADLIPEIPTVPELKTETETASEVAVAD